MKPTIPVDNVQHVDEVVVLEATEVRAEDEDLDLLLDVTPYPGQAVR